MPRERQPPQPHRFERFTELRDGSGFRIPNCSYVFLYDRDGGWLDEYGNHFDRNGRPDEPSSDEPHSDDDRSFSKSESSDDEDDYQREFGGPTNDFEDEEETAHIQQLSRIAANIEVLNAYPCNEPFRIHFRNLNYFSRREEVFYKFAEKVEGIINLIFFNNEKGQFNGKGYFVVGDVHAGERLIKLEGQKFGDREITFELEDVEEFLLSPIKSSEIKCDFAQKSKHYTGKTEPKKVEPIAKEPTQQIPNEVEVKEQPKKAKVQEAKVEAKTAVIKPQVVNLQEFATYTFLKKAFPKKTSFKQWLTAHKFGSSDYQTVEKIVGNEDYAKITMKRKVYSALNNSTYNGEKIVFIPQ